MIKPWILFKQLLLEPFNVLNFHGHVTAILETSNRINLFCSGLLDIFDNTCAAKLVIAFEFNPIMSVGETNGAWRLDYHRVAYAIDF